MRRNPLAALVRSTLCAPSKSKRTTVIGEKKLGRALRAFDAIRTHSGDADFADPNFTVRDKVADLVRDLRHLCDLAEVDWASALDSGLDYDEEEKGDAS